MKKGKPNYLTTTSTYILLSLIHLDFPFFHLVTNEKEKIIIKCVLFGIPTGLRTVIIQSVHIKKEKSFEIH